MSKYKIVRFRFEEAYNPKASCLFLSLHTDRRSVIKSGLTLDQAQEWCRRDDTRGEGWFDGYESQ